MHLGFMSFRIMLPGNGADYVGLALSIRGEELVAFVPLIV